LKKYFGEKLNADVRSLDVFEELRSKYHVFFIHKPYYDLKIDAKHLAAWEKAVGSERVLHLNDPKAVIDVMLGATAIVAGSRSLNRYDFEMEGRGQTQHRVEEVNRALGLLSLAVEKERQKDVKERTEEKKQEEKKEEPKAEPFPPNFICPLTHEPFQDPVFIDDGYTYERSAIELWLQTHNTSPMTNETVESKKVRPNIVLRNSLAEYRASLKPSQ